MRARPDPKKDIAGTKEKEKFIRSADRPTRARHR